MRLYPRKAGSSAVGALARMRLPDGLRRPLLGRFAAAFGANLDEAEKDLGAYVSFLDFFTRRLKPGARPQAPAVPGGINSPVDGLLIAEGRVKEDTLLQAKGLRVPPRRAPRRGSARFGILARALRDALPRSEGLSPHPRPAHRGVRRGGARGGRALARERGIHGFDAAPLREKPPRVLDRPRRAGGRGARRGGRHGGGDARRRRRRGPALARWPRATRAAAGSRLRIRPCASGDDLGAFELGSTVVLLVGGPKAMDWDLTRGLGPVKVGERLGGFRG